MIIKIITNTKIVVAVANSIVDDFFCSLHIEHAVFVFIIMYVQPRSLVSL